MSEKRTAKVVLPTSFKIKGRMIEWRQDVNQYGEARPPSIKMVLDDGSMLPCNLPRGALMPDDNGEVTITVEYDTSVPIPADDLLQALVDADSATRAKVRRALGLKCVDWCPWCSKDKKHPAL